MDNKETQKPIIKNWNAGKTVSVWENKKDNGDIYYSVSVQNKYKRGEEEVKETLHIFPDDLLFLAELCRITYTDLYGYRYKNKVKPEQVIEKQVEPAPFNDDIPW